MLREAIKVKILHHLRVRILWQHRCNLKKMINSGHDAIVCTGSSPIKLWIRIYSSVYDAIREHRLPLNPHYESSKLIEFFRLAILPHGFHLAIDDLHCISKLF